MKESKDTKPAESAASQHSEQQTHTSSTALKNTSKFGWAKALFIAIPLVLVGVFIVINTFAATKSQNYVIGLYKGLLGRTVTTSDSGVQYWAKKIDSGTSETAVFTAIYNSSEAKKYREKLINGGSSGTSGGSSSSGSSGSTGTQTSSYAAELAWVNAQCAALKLRCGVAANENRARGLAAKKTTRPKVLADLQALVKTTKDQTSTKTTSSGNTSSSYSPSQCRKKVKKDFGSYLSGLGADLDRRDDYINSIPVKSVVKDAVEAAYRKYSTDRPILAVDEAVQKILDCELTLKQLIAQIQGSDAGKAKAERDAKLRQAKKDIVGGLWEAYAGKAGGSMSVLCKSNYEKFKAGQLTGGPGPSCWLAVGYPTGTSGYDIVGGINAVADGEKSADQVVSEILAALEQGNRVACSELGEAAANVPSCAAGEEFVSDTDLQTISNPAPRTDNPANSTTRTTGSNSPYRQTSGTTTVSR